MHTELLWLKTQFKCQQNHLKRLLISTSNDTSADLPNACDQHETADTSQAVDAETSQTVMDTKISLTSSAVQQE